MLDEALILGVQNKLQVVVLDGADNAAWVKDASKYAIGAGLAFIAFSRVFSLDMVPSYTITAASVIGWGLSAAAEKFLTPMAEEILASLREERKNRIFAVKELKRALSS